MKKLLLSLMIILVTNASFLFATTYTWTGSISTQWSDIANWSVPPGTAPGNPPASSDDVIIPSSISGSNWPTLNITGYCKSITINGTFNLSSNMLVVYGDFTNNGTFNSGNGMVRFRGTTQNVYGSSTFYDIYAVDYSTTIIVFNGSETVSHNLSIGCTLDTGGNTLTGGNQLFITSAGVLKIGGSNGINSFSSYSIDYASTINYNGSNQNIGKTSATIYYGNIIISGTDTKTLIADIYARDITVQSGIFDLGSHYVYAVIPPSEVPVMTLQSGTTLRVGGSGFSGSYNNSFDPASTVEYYGDVTQSVDGSFGSFGNLTFSGTGQKWIPSNNTIVNGTLTLYSGYTMNGYTKLNVVNGNYHYAGSDVQTVTSKTYNNMHISGGSTKTLEGTATINGALTLTNGKISTNSYILTLGSSGSISGASASNYIIANGYLKREGVGSSVDFSFPVGPDATSYNPIIINNSGTSDRFDVHVETGITPGHANSGYCLPRTWTISEGTAGGSNASITFQWAGSDENANFTESRTENRIQAFRYNGSAWVAVGSAGGASGPNPYTFTITGVTEFSNFILGDSDAPLPVELTSFTASSAPNKVTLNWQTATEVNNYGFDVERAVVETQHAASLRWDKISFVKGNGNSNSPKEYSFTDKPIGGQQFQYRLKQIDFDGQFEYSDPVEVKLEVPANFVLLQNFPNPFNPTTNIKFDLPKESIIKLKIYNILGEEVTTLVNSLMTPGHHEVKFDGSYLASGMYIYRIEAGSFIQVKKMLLMK
jgi:hypothetical protein